MVTQPFVSIILLHLQRTIDLLVRENVKMHMIVITGTANQYNTGILALKWAYSLFCTSVGYNTEGSE